jgi:hypothetical protein
MSKHKHKLQNGIYMTHAEIAMIFPTFDYPEKALVMLGYARETLPFDHKHRWLKTDIAAFVRKRYPADISAAFDKAISLPTPRRISFGGKAGGEFK